MNQSISKSTHESLHGQIDHAAEGVKAGTTKAAGEAKDKFNAAADRTEGALHHAADAVARGAHRATDKAEGLRERGAEAASYARDHVDQATTALREFVYDKPVVSIGIALAAGWLMARVVNTRR